MKDKNVYITNSEEETKKLGFDFARNLKKGDLVLLYGELGSGKTEFIKGMCDYFKVNDIVTSPTFSIINQYEGLLDDNFAPLFHIDLYRIKSKKELDEIGFQEAIASEDCVKFVEWADKAGDNYPENRYVVEISYLDEGDKREVKISK